MELIIMAGGMGSRYGGLKQLEKIDENGNFLIDYSIYDAIRAGFDKIVIVIKRENYNLFEETIGKRVRPYVKLSYVFQSNEGFLFREKPLGTGHAVLICENEISENFAVINADDFYGYESFAIIYESLKNLDDRRCTLVAFDLEKTLSPFGSVKRGICEIKNDKLVSITECEVELNENRLLAKDLITNKIFEIEKNSPVSMNLWGFNKSIFKYLKREFGNFCSDKTNLISNEFFLPSAIKNMIKNNEIEITVKKTPSKWLGLTYKTDSENVKKTIKNLVIEGIYPQNLWNN